VGRFVLAYYGAILLGVVFGVAVLGAAGLLSLGEIAAVALLGIAIVTSQLGSVLALRKRLDGIDRDATARHHHHGRAISELVSRINNLSKKVAAFQLRSTSGDEGPVPIHEAEIVEVEESGTKVRFDLTPDHHIHRRIRAEGRLYEHELLDFVFARFRHGLAIADVGANVGNHAVFFGKVMEAKPLICFEASPVAVQHLHRNLELNSVEAIVVDEALGETVGHGTLWLRADQAFNPGAARLEVGQGDIPITTLDAVMRRKGIEALDLIKIDVEGMELPVLRGGAAVLEKSKPDLLLELQTEVDLAEARALLGPLGYQQGEQFNYTPTYHFFVPGPSAARGR
jgi:FkbM family methyltransferase